MTIKVTWHLTVTQVIDSNAVEEAIKRSKHDIVNPLREKLGKRAVQVSGIISSREDCLSAETQI